MPTAVQRKQTQRHRILAATIDLAARDGYTATTIEQIIAQAGVSRPTFYEYFADKDACLLGAIVAVNEQLLAHVEAATSADPPEHATATTIEAIVGFCRAQPAMARVLLNESLAGRSQALDARDQGIAALARVIDTARQDVPARKPLPDLDSTLLVAGILRLLGSYLRRGSAPDAATLAALLAWVDSYALPTAQQRWSRLVRRPPTAVAEAFGEPPFGQPPLETASRFPAARAERNRQRLFFAAAELARQNRLATASIAEITRRAGVGYRTFARLFTSKQDLFIALHELGHRRTMAAAIAAYFVPAPWPERVWAAGQAYTQFVAQNPTIAHVGFLEPYAAGPRAAQSMKANVLAIFTVFLAEGDVNVPAGRERPSRLAFDAIAATIFELGFRAVRSGNAAELPALLPQAVFLVLAPFLGAQEASRFVEGKLAAIDAGDGADR